MNLQTNLGIAIKEFRNNLGLSQEKFALSIETVSYTHLDVYKRQM